MRQSNQRQILRLIADVRQNMKYISLILVALLLPIVCVNATYPYDDINSTFVEHRGSFEKIRSMIISDSKPNGGLCIAYKRVGAYEKYGSKWTHVSDSKKSLPEGELFRKYSITAERYQQYMELFKTISKSRISYFEFNGVGRTSIGSHIELGIIGTSVDVEKNDDMSIPSSKLDAENKGVKIIPLEDGWYISWFRA
jgi:hypothetical protein